MKEQDAVVAEWLRRWTWNPMGFPRAGSNPAGCEIFFFFLHETTYYDDNASIIGHNICKKFINLCDQFTTYIVQEGNLSQIIILFLQTLKLESNDSNIIPTFECL